MYFARPRELNDVFDCRPHVASDVSQAAAEQFFLDLVHDTLGIDSAVVRENARRMSQDAGSWQQSWTNVCDDFGVYSLSATCEEPLMWAHYGGDHKGYALGFEGLDALGMSSSAEFMPTPVQYESNRFRVPASVLVRAVRDGEFDADAMWLSLCCKDARWEYEREWRLIRRGGGESLCPPLSVLKEIVLGVRCTPEDEATLRRWVAESGQTVEFARVRASNSGYSIELIR